MKRVMFVLFFLLLTVGLLQKKAIVSVEASPDIYQGDLILNGNNVTVIEGRFDINGSIIVEENATLILQNAVLNFTQVDDFQFTMIFRNPVNGNPRLLAENTTIASSGYYLEIDFYGNTSASLNNLTASTAYLYGWESSVTEISNATLWDCGGLDFAIVNLANCDLCFAIEAREDSSFSVFNCTLQLLQAYSRLNIDVLNSTIEKCFLVTQSANCSVDGLKPGFFDYWDFQQNCSVLTAPGGWASNLTLTGTQVESWKFEIYEYSNITISNSKLNEIYARGFSDVFICNSTTEYLNTRLAHTTFRFVNSTSNRYNIQDQSEVYVCWYLDVHVTDSIGQNVPSANVTATYPNATTAGSKLTDIDGWATFTLVEKMKNATGEYPVGNYTVEAAYETHSKSTSVNMTGNQQIILQLEDFVIPEYPINIMMLLLIAITTLVITFSARKTLRKTQP